MWAVRGQTVRQALHRHVGVPSLSSFFLVSHLLLSTGLWSCCVVHMSGFDVSHACRSLCFSLSFSPVRTRPRVFSFTGLHAKPAQQGHTKSYFPHTLLACCPLCFCRVCNSSTDMLPFSAMCLYVCGTYVWGLMHGMMCQPSSFFTFQNWAMCLAFGHSAFGPEVSATCVLARMALNEVT